MVLDDGTNPFPNRWLFYYIRNNRELHDECNH